MRFIKVEFASEQYLVNLLKVTKLCLFECINFKEVKEQILKNL